MNYLRLLVPIAAMLVAAAPVWGQGSANRLTAEEAQQGWKLLFDGKTLNGWEARTTSDPQAKPDWSAKDGALLCGGTAPSWLATVDEFANYKLRLQLRGPALVNSGVFLRSQKQGEPHVTGYELQVWDKQPDGYNTGSLVNYVRAPPATLLADEWNQYEITADGDHFVVAINGKTVLNAREGSHSSGVIGLQCQPEQRIEYRNIKVLPRP